MIGLPLFRPVCEKAEVSDGSRTDEAEEEGCTYLIDAIVDFCKAGRIIFKVDVDLIEAKTLQHGLGV